MGSLANMLGTKWQRQQQHRRTHTHIQTNERREEGSLPWYYPNFTALYTSENEMQSMSARKLIFRIISITALRFRMYRCTAHIIHTKIVNIHNNTQTHTHKLFLGPYKSIHFVQYTRIWMHHSTMPRYEQEWKQELS